MRASELACQFDGSTLAALAQQDARAQTIRRAELGQLSAAAEDNGAPESGAVVVVARGTQLGRLDAERASDRRALAKRSGELHLLQAAREMKRAQGEGAICSSSSKATIERASKGTRKAETGELACQAQESCQNCAMNGDEKLD